MGDTPSNTTLPASLRALVAGLVGEEGPVPPSQRPQIEWWVGGVIFGTVVGSKQWCYCKMAVRLHGRSSVVIYCKYQRRVVYNIRQEETRGSSDRTSIKLLSTTRVNSVPQVSIWALLALTVLLTKVPFSQTLTCFIQLRKYRINLV